MSKWIRIVVGFSVFVGSVAGYGAPGGAAELVEVWGSTTCQKRFLEPGAADLREATGITLNVNGVGTGEGLVALIEGRTAISAASESLADAVRSANKVAVAAGKELSIPDNLVFHEIKKDRIIPIVHEDNPVQKLSWAQLRDIHNGTTTNWNEVGGPDLPITVVTSHVGSATRGVFQKLVMKGDPYVSGAVEVDSTRKEILEVSNQPGAIGAVSLGFLKMYQGKTRTIRTTPIGRPLGLITRGEPTGDTKLVIDFFQSYDRGL